MTSMFPLLQASVVPAAAGGAGGGRLSLPGLLRLRPRLHRRLPARPAPVVQQGCQSAATSAGKKIKCYGPFIKDIHSGGGVVGPKADFARKFSIGRRMR